MSKIAAAKKLDIQVVAEPPWRVALEQRLTRYTSRPDWLAARAEGIGGSEAAIIMGASTWGSPYQLWSEKAGLAPADDFDNEVLRFGRVVEPHIAAEYERLTGRQLINLGEWAIRKHAKHRWMFCTHDRLISPLDDRGPGVLSMKAANVWRGVEWLEGEEPPLVYQVQFQHELSCSGLQWGSFAVLIWGKGVMWQDVQRNDAFIDVLETECADFWRRVEKGDPPPIDGSEHTTGALRKLYPYDSDPPVVLPPECADWANEIQACTDKIKELDARKEQLKNEVRKLLGNASAGEVPGGPGWTNLVRGARPAGYIPERFVPEQVIPGHEYPGDPGTRYLLLKLNGLGGKSKKKGKAA